MLDGGVRGANAEGGQFLAEGVAPTGLAEAEGEAAKRRPVM